MPAQGVTSQIRTAIIWVSYQPRRNLQDSLKARCLRARAQPATAANKVKTLRDRKDLSSISMLLQVQSIYLYFLANVLFNILVIVPFLYSVTIMQYYSSCIAIRIQSFSFKNSKDIRKS